MDYVAFLITVLFLATASGDAPYIETAPQDQAVTAGGKALFFCIAGGNPSPQIDWHRNSKKASSVRYSKHSIANGSVLRIDRVRSGRDQAKFHCIAKNDGGTAVASASLTVYPQHSVPHGFPEFVREPNIKAVEGGRNVSLPCQVDGNPQPEVIWLKDNVPLNTTNSRYSVNQDSLEITDARKEDEGGYECMAQNSVGSAISAQGTLYVKVRKVLPYFSVIPDPRYEVHPGSSLNVTCIAVGSPMPLVKWHFGSVEITPQSTGKNTLMLQNIMLSANYTCIAISKLGIIETTTEIAVKDSNQNVTRDSDLLLPECNCDEQHLDNLKTELCIPVFVGGCTCPTRYVCPGEKSVDQNNAHADSTPEIECLYEGKTYKLGQEIKTIDYCLNCSCTQVSEGAEMLCAEVNCPDVFQPPKEANCYQIHEDGRCCPVNVMCTPAEPNVTVHLIKEYPQIIAVVSWSAPSHDFEHLQYYKLGYGRKDSSKMKEIILDAGTLSQTVYNLDRGANYRFYVAGRNYIRWGPEGVAFLNIPEHNSSLGTGVQFISSTPMPLPKCDDNCYGHFMKHYETKNCTPVFEPGCPCPKRFDCPYVQITPGNVCVYQEKAYRLGEYIPTTDLCQRCSCRRNFLGGAEMSCVHVECPSHFRLPPKEGCYEVYEPNKCCSVEVKCENRRPENASEPTCEYDGKVYHQGERIYLKDDPCLSCFCDESWTGERGDHCHTQDCFLETKMPYLRRGCLPIYHEGKCCPIDLYCGAGDLKVLNNAILPSSYDECAFEGKLYSIGEVLDTSHQTNCVTCTCITPPDFTCVHKSCPGPPNNDYENCRSVYHNGECCPTYECPQQSAALTCEPIKCVNGCRAVQQHEVCPLCLCDNLLCVPPRCPENCEIEYDVPYGTCPRCKCANIQLAPVRCTPVECSPQCFEAVGSDGCPECMCGTLCSPPKCAVGCSVQKVVPRGQCRGCICPPGLESDLVDGILYDQQVQCAAVVCPPACNETVGSFGCPTCSCDPCPPPECSPDCKVEPFPLSGLCPGCICDEG